MKDVDIYTNMLASRELTFLNKGNEKNGLLNDGKKLLFKFTSLTFITIITFLHRCYVQKVQYAGILYLFFIKSIQAQQSYYVPPTSDDYQITEAFYYNGDTSITLQDVRNMMNITSISYLSISPIDIEFDASPVAWFIVKMNGVKLVHQFIVKSGDYNEFNSIGGIWLSFRLNSDRDFVVYTEFNQTKIFKACYNSSRWFIYDLLNPFMASEVQVLVSSENFSMYFTMDFRFIEPIEYKFEKPVLGLYQFMADDFLSIQMNKSLFIAGMKFDKIDSLLRFCIQYYVSNKVVMYKDNSLFDNTVFTVSQRIFLRPFRTSEINLKCLVWFLNMTQDISITLLGDDYLSADYIWLQTDFIKYPNKNYYIYTNNKGTQKLFGNSESFQKNYFSTRLMSNHFGDDCFTQPHLCVSGFTIQLDVAVPFSTNLNWVPFYATDVFSNNKLWNESSNLIYFGSTIKNTFLVFNKFIFPSTADSIQSHLHIIGLKSMLNSSKTYSAKIYAFSTILDKTLTAQSCSKYYEDGFFSSYNKLITFDCLDNNHGFVLTDIIKILKLQNNGVINSLCLMVEPLSQVEVNVLKLPTNNFVLYTFHKDNVVGDVRSLKELNVNESSVENSTLDKFYNYSVDVTFDQDYYMTGIQLWSESPIDVDLLVQAKYFNVPKINIAYVTITKISLNGGESQFVPFDDVIKAKYFKILLTTEIILKYKFYGTENTYWTSPILSAGLGGYQTATHGNGFQIHLTNNQITATVVTIYGKYKVSMTNPSSAPYTLTLVWSVFNDTLYLYYNDTLKDTGVINAGTNFSSCFFNEYLLVFADYYNNQSGLRTTLSKITMWSTPLSENEVSQIINQEPFAEYSYLGIKSSDFLYGSDCNCKNKECPCETLETTATVEYVSRFATVFEVFKDDDLNNDQNYVDLVNTTQGLTYMYFDEIVLDFKSVSLVEVYLDVMFINASKTYFGKSSIIRMQIFNNSNEISLQVNRWSISTKYNNSFTSPDMTDLLKNILKISSYELPLTVVIKINDLNIQPKGFLRIKYKMPESGGFIYASAMLSSSDDIFTKLYFFVIGKCLSFTFKFGGTGFVNLVVFGNINFLKTRLAYYYRQEAQDKWIKSFLDLSFQNYETVEFIAYKNGLGVGYISFGTFQFYKSCPDEKTSYAGNLALQQNTTLSIPVVTVADFDDFYATIKNAFIIQESYLVYQKFFNGFTTKANNKILNFSWLVSDFTILFWFKDGYLYNIFNMTCSSGDFIIVSQQNLNVLISSNKLNATVPITHLTWHYLVIQYDKNNLKFVLQIDFQQVITYDSISFADSYLSMLVHLSYNIFCFQVYQEVLFPSAIGAVQFCPIKQWDLACKPGNHTCEWCNAFYGTWEFLPLNYIIEKKMDECFKVPDAPLSIFNYTEDRKTLRVEWIPPKNSYGIMSYEICRRQLYLNGTNGLYYCFKQSNLLVFNLTNLDGASTHNISVSACNSAGCSKPTYIIARLSSFAPERSPENFTAIFNQSSIQFKWNSLENTTDAWGDYKIPGFYQLHYGLVKSPSLKNISFTTINLTDNQFVLQNVNSCYFYIASLNAFSVGAGPENYICIQDYLSMPFCITSFIESVYVSSSSASFFAKRFLPNYLRGSNTYWLFHVNVVDQYYNPGPPPDKYLQRPVYLNQSLEKYSGISNQCTQYDLVEYFDQSTDFVLDLVGLHPNTKYEVSMQPCNELGCGNISNNVTIQTYSDVPSCEPTLLQMQSFSSTSMNISWNKLNSSCANIDLNQISYTLKCYQSQGNNLLNKKINNTTILLSGLNSYEQLCCEVAALNINGTGPFSSQNCAFTDEDIPDAPTFISTNYIKNDRTIRLEWSSVSLQNSHGIITSYEICRRQLYVIDSMESNYCFKQWNSSILEFYLTGLQLSSTYNISVAACNTAGCGEQIFIAASFIPFAPDHAPDNFTAIFNKTMIQFKWDSLENTTDAWGVNKIPGFYQLHYGLVKSSSVKNTSFTNINTSDTHWFVLKNIDLCFLYIASLNAFSVDAGPKYFICFQSNLSEPLCMKPFISSFYVSGSNSASFTASSFLPTFFRGTNTYWLFHVNVTNQNYNPGPPPKKYLQKPVYFNQSLEKYSGKSNRCTQEDLVEYFNQSTNFVLDLVALHPYTQYEVSIQPCNELGCGNISNSVTIQTYSDVPSCEPTLLQLESLSSTSINISWNKVKLSCANIDINQISYILICNGSKINARIFNTTLLVSSLKMYDVLCCQVAASNINGTGPFSSQICASTEDDRDIGFSEWLEWSFCSETCGESSFMIRTRTCNGNCSGLFSQKKKCKVPVCAVDGIWTSWGPWGSCNATCGYGVSIRTRACDPPPLGSGAPCYGPNIDIFKECVAFPCPVNGGFSEWTEWSICDKPCGNGTSKRVRYCNNPVPAINGKECSGDFIITRDCWMNPCKSIKVNLVQRTLEKWMWKMYNIISYEAQNFTINFKNSVQSCFNQNDLKGLTNIIVNKLEMGSVIVNYTLKFQYLYGQIVEYLDLINSTKKLMNIAISSTQYYSNDVPCPPPYNINVSLFDKFNVWISWSRDRCNNTEVWLYIYFKDITNPNSIWEWKGIPSEDQSVILLNLAPFHTYKAYMLTASSYGNGLPSSVFRMQTLGASPERPPANATTRSLSSTKIYVEWTDTLEQYRNGKILGYKIRYKVYWSNDPLKEVDAQYGYNAFILKALKPFTLYYVDVYGYNLFGAGPSIYSMCKTLEDAPSVPVPNIQIIDMQSSDWWSISWDPIPVENTNGVLLGYRLIYYMNYRSGQEITGEKLKYTIEFDPFTHYYKQTNLLNYAIYNFSIVGFTTAGSSPAQEFQARTCKCKEVLFANSFIKDPFVLFDGKKVTGNFVNFLQDMVVQSCGTCNGYSSKLSKLYFDRTKFGGNPVKNSEFDLKLSISNDIDISFPIYGRNGYEVATNTSFMLLIQSPGIAAVQRDEHNADVMLAKMISKVLNVWSFLLISYVLGLLFGIFFWFTDQFINPEQFIIGNALKGILSGFWFAFITMTTIGYGDLTPRSFFAKLVSIIWFIIGLSLNCITIGFIVTNITTVTLPADFIMYDTKAAALQNSFEYKTAVQRNARLHNESYYKTIDVMLDDLQNGDIDIVYIDIYYLLDYQKILERKLLKLAFIDSLKTGYGIVLSGSTTALLTEFKSFIKEKSITLMKFTQAFQTRLPALETENTQETIAYLYTKSSQYKTSLICLGILLCLMTIFGLCMDFIKQSKKNKVHNKLNITDDIEELVSNFHTKFNAVAEQITQDHREDYVRLFNLKKRYYNKSDEFSEIMAL
ncbi:uncharacterized protein LOC101238067 isoform X4 [Hydra vulgaris]|uniref:Uncharacterized protein LOC101238067 isoform X4 n=1 Tax=Hydra vulgaris TaxID=6087 RepID=A0ABM4D5S6_HYDVU